MLRCIGQEAAVLLIRTAPSCGLLLREVACDHHRLWRLKKVARGISQRFFRICRMPAIVSLEALMDQILN